MRSGYVYKKCLLKKSFLFISNFEMKHYFKFIAVLLLFSLFNSNLSAAMFPSADPPVYLNILDKDFPLFKDSDEKVLYIDFELLTTNVSKLRIIDQNGVLKFQDDVSKNKVDSIYEIDYSTFDAGIYRLELHTYTGKILNAQIDIH